MIREIKDADPRSWSDASVDWTTTRYADDHRRWITAEDVVSRAEGEGDDPVGVYLLVVDVLAAVAYGQPDVSAITSPLVSPDVALALGQLANEYDPLFIDAVAATVFALATVRDFPTPRMFAASVYDAAVGEGDKLARMGKPFVELVRNFGPLALKVIYEKWRMDLDKLNREEVDAE